MRIGHGFDVHAFGSLEPIIIGGVTIPHVKGVLSHSDGDVLIHALIDAILGAAALGDIGNFFPDFDPAFKDADSRAMLRMIWESIKEKGYTIGNIDITIIAQLPKMVTHISKIRSFLSQDLLCDINDINVKATTTERLGFIGREEGIACSVVVLINE